MANNKLTVFQRLGLALSPDNAKRNQPATKQTSRYNLGNDVLLKTQNKAEYEMALKQAHQNKLLGNVWRKVENGLFQQSINYETSRISSYADFEAMEFYPTIAAALDIMAEESTTINEKGKILNIYSDSKRVKGILEDLFYNRLDAHVSLPVWTRNTCKYGDNFVFLNIDDTHGILGAKQMPNYEMDRVEGSLVDMINNTSTNDVDKTRFVWRGHNVEFNSWQIAHFRLMGDDRRLPYGTSILEKSRRIWKQLILAEDSMLVYRVTRAPERRVYKIYVGNIDDADVPAYVDAIADRFKRIPVIDPQTGQMDLRLNQLANDQDYFIPVRTEDAPNPIDTLPGAQNLDQIADIEYLRSNLFTALRVPKPFLGFDETNGEGKNLALQDIRFSRTINRIQQAILQELNKIAIIHLFLLGFEEDFDNFTLTLNNPSTQAEMLKIEHLQNKVTLFKDAVSDAGNGFAAMSMTKAKREILGMSDDEIKQDLLEQRMEKAAAAELARTEGVIKHTGVFDVVDRIYGDMNAAINGGGNPAGGEEGEGGAGGGGGLGGSFGGGGVGGEDLNFGEEGEDEASTEAGGETGAADDLEGGAEAEAGAEDQELADTENLAESIRKTDKLLKEQKLALNEKLKNRAKKYKGRFVDVLIESIKPDGKPTVEKVKIYDKSMKINNDVNDMINGINKMLGE